MATQPVIQSDAEVKRLLSDMKAVRAHHAWTRDHIGQPGCEVRKVASEYADICDRILAFTADLQSSLDEALLRLGALGLSPKLDADVQDVVERLGALVQPSHKPYPTHARNPDGADAVAVIERLSARVGVLEEALRPFADCCEQINADESDEEWAKFRLLVKDYRRARAALPIEGASNGG